LTPFRALANLSRYVKRSVAAVLMSHLLLASAVLPAQEPQRPPPIPQEPALEEPPAAEETLPEEVVGPAPGAPTLTLAAAVRIALERNFALLNSADSVQSARYRESAARGQFYPQLVPRYQHGPAGSAFGLDVAQRVPWSGATVTATGLLTSLADETLSPFPKSTDLRVVLSQPLLRGFGPNTTFYELRNSERSRIGQQRTYELNRQRLAVQVAAAFYDVVAQRQLVAVARQSLKRSDSLRRASEARLQVGLVSKLDVFRTELQSSQTEDSMVRSEAALRNALEQFRFLLAVPPDDPVEPSAVVLPEALAPEGEAVDELVRTAFANRLELRETEDQVQDARRTASLARQNLLPQLDVGVGVSQIGTGPSFSDAWRVGDTRVDFFVATSYPVERSQDRAAKAVADLDVATRERAVRQRELEIDSEVRLLARELARTRKSVELQRQAVEVAAQQRRLADLRYQRGLASNFDVVDAEGSLLQARSTLVSLLASYQVALLDLRRAAGTLDVDREFAP
jgi:outer membrane protein